MSLALISLALHVCELLILAALLGRVARPGAAPLTLALRPSRVPSEALQAPAHTGPPVYTVIADDTDVVYEGPDGGEALRTFEGIASHRAASFTHRDSAGEHCRGQRGRVEPT